MYLNANNTAPTETKMAIGVLGAPMPTKSTAKTNAKNIPQVRVNKSFSALGGFCMAIV